MDDLLRVGVVTSPHGVRGEVKVYPTTDDLERFRELKHVIIDFGKEKKELEVVGVKFLKGMAVLKFRGYDNREDVETWRQKSLFVTRANAVPCEEGEYYIADLIGLDVWTDEGKQLGVLVDVIQTGANDVYVVRMENKKEVLIPAIKACILNVDLQNNKMDVHLLEGLLEL